MGSTILSGVGSVAGSLLGATLATESYRMAVNQGSATAEALQGDASRLANNTRNALKKYAISMHTDLGI